MKRNTVWNLIFVFIFLLMLAGEAFAVITIVRLDMLPDLYLLALLGILAVFSLAIGLLLFIRGKKSGKVRRILAGVLAIVVICGCIAIGTVATDVMKTLEATSREFLEIPTREIYVLAEDTAQILEDTAGYTYGYIKGYDESCTEQVLAKIRQKTNTQVATAGYLDILSMVDALLEKRIDAIVINGALISLLEAEDAYMDFSDRARVLDQITVEEAEIGENMSVSFEKEENAEVTVQTIPQDVPEETQPEAEEYTELEPFVVYLSGSDSYDDQIVKYGRSDVNILAVVNPMSKQVLLINSPRDFYVRNTASQEKEYDKLTHCGIYGTKCSMNTLGNLYGINVDYFVRINFSGFKKLIDALGGITVYSDYAFTAITRTPIQEGENHLTGQEALDYARERVTVPGGDGERGRHQMQVITAVIEKATTGTTVISNYSDIMESVEGMFHMNVPTELISDMMKMQLSDMARWNVASFSVTGEYAREECYSMPGVVLSVTKPYSWSVYKAARLIDLVFAGELLTEEVMNSIS